MRIQVKFKPTGELGTIEQNEFDPKIYEKIGGEAQSQPEQKKGSILDSILGFGGKAAEFLAPTTSKQYKAAFQNLDPNVPIEQKVKNLQDIESNEGKSALELYSYLIPYGKGGNILTKTVAPALAQYGASRISQDKPLEASGAITSVVTSAVLGKLLGLGKKSKEIGEIAQESVLNPQAKADPFYSKTRESLTKVAKDAGLKGSASDQLRQLPKVFEGVQTKIKGMLGKTNITQNEAKDVFINKLEETTDYVAGDKAWGKIVKEMSNKIGKLGTEFSDEAVYNLKSELGNNLKKVFGKPQLTPKEQARMALFESLKDVLDAKVPGISELNSIEHKLYELAPGLVSSSKEKIIAPIIGQLQGIPGLREGLQRATDKTGSLLQTGGNILDTITKPLQSSGGQNMLNQIIQRGLGQETPQQPQQTPQSVVPEAQTEEIFSPGKQWKWDAKANDWVKNEAYQPTQASGVQGIDQLQKIIPMLMVQDLQNTGGKNVSKLKTILDTSKGPSLSAAEKTAVKSANDGLDLVDTLYGQYQKVQSKGLTAQSSGLGRLGGLKGSAASLLQNDADAAAYEATKKAFLSKLSRATGEKGVLTDPDIKRIESAIPDFYDTPQTAETKTKLVKQIIGDAIAAKQGSTEQTDGVDVLMQLLLSQ